MNGEFDKVSKESIKQCCIINSTNPLAVARNIEKMYKLVTIISKDISSCWATTAIDLLNDIRKEV